MNMTKQTCNKHNKKLEYDWNGPLYTSNGPYEIFLICPVQRCGVRSWYPWWYIPGYIKRWILKHQEFVVRVAQFVSRRNFYWGMRVYSLLSWVMPGFYARDSFLK